MELFDQLNFQHQPHNHLMPPLLNSRPTTSQLLRGLRLPGSFTRRSPSENGAERTTCKKGTRLWKLSWLL